MLRHPPGADHLDVVVHQLARAGGVADFDQRGSSLCTSSMRCATSGVSVGFSRRPRDVLQRDELHHQHAVVRGLGDRQVEVAARAGCRPRRRRSSPRPSASSCLQPRDVGVGGVLGRELGGEAFDRALRVHDLGGGDAGEVELHRERLGEQPRIAARDARAAALAHLDLDDAERLQACAARRAPRSG